MSGTQGGGYIILEGFVELQGCNRRFSDSLSRLSIHLKLMARTSACVAGVFIFISVTGKYSREHCTIMTLGLESSKRL